MTEDRSAADRELAQLRATAGEQEMEIARLRDEAAEASGELADRSVEAQEFRRRERDLSALVERLRSEARVHEDAISRLLERLLADERELNDLRAVRDALTPPKLAGRPGVELAASFLPATEGVSGDFYLVAEGPHETTTLLVGDVVGKGLGAARRAAFIRTVFATTAPFSDDPARLLSWANTALVERAQDALEFVTVGCVTVSPRDRMLRWRWMTFNGTPSRAISTALAGHLDGACVAHRRDGEHSRDASSTRHIPHTRSALLTVAAPWSGAHDQPVQALMDLRQLAINTICADGRYAGEVVGFDDQPAVSRPGG